ncbi:hypothetical protein QOT17_015050 [Balamuthia mandrillaris]
MKQDCSKPLGPSTLHLPSTFATDLFDDLFADLFDDHFNDLFAALFTDLFADHFNNLFAALFTSDLSNDLLSDERKRCHTSTEHEICSEIVRAWESSNQG